MEKGRWTKFSLPKSSEKMNDRVSIRDAIGIWLKSANSTNPIQFRETCYLAHCNEQCPEQIKFEQDESYLWKQEFEVFIYCFVAIVTLICFIIKGVFFCWHRILLRKQEQFLQRARETEKANTTYNYQVHRCFNYICICVLLLVCLCVCL